MMLYSVLFSHHSWSNIGIVLAFGARHKGSPTAFGGQTSGNVWSQSRFSIFHNIKHTKQNKF